EPEQRQEQRAERRDRDAREHHHPEQSGHRDRGPQEFRPVVGRHGAQQREEPARIDLTAQRTPNLPELSAQIVDPPVVRSHRHSPAFKTTNMAPSPSAPPRAMPNTSRPRCANRTWLWTRRLCPSSSRTCIITICCSIPFGTISTDRPPGRPTPCSLPQPHAR